MADIFQEIDEAMRQERLEKLWKNYGAFIIGGIVAIILLTAGFVAWKNWQSTADRQATLKLHQAMNAQDPAQALSVLAGDTRPGHTGMAYLQAAGLYLERESRDKALQMYDALIRDESAPSDFVGLARILKARLLMDMTGREAVSPDLITEAIAPLLQDRTSPWHWHAALVQALYQANIAGEYEAARSTIAAILSADNAPGVLKNRVRALDHLYALKARADQSTAPQPAGE